MNIDLGFLISFLVITVTYSSFINPAVTQLTKLRDKLPHLDYPVEDIWSTQNHTQQTVLATKLRQDMEAAFRAYEIKHAQLKRTLKLFYGILAILLIIQIATAINTTILHHILGTSRFQPWFTTGVLLIVSYLIYRVLSSSITSPIALRSRKWLTHEAFINPVHIDRASRGSLAYSQEEKGGVSTSFVLAQETYFTGYRYIFLVRDKNDTVIHYARIGEIGAEETQKNYDVDGSYTYYTELGDMVLAEGEYTAALVCFNMDFKKDKKRPAGTKLNFEIKANGGGYISSSTTMDFENYNTKDKSIEASTENVRLKNITVDDTKPGVAIVMKNRYAKAKLRSRKIRKPLTLYSKNGASNVEIGLFAYVLDKLLLR